VEEEEEEYLFLAHSLWFRLPTLRLDLQRQLLLWRVQAGPRARMERCK
jgi:hypothetical protein